MMDILFICLTPDVKKSIINTFFFACLFRVYCRVGYTVKPFIFAASFFRESVTEDIVAATKFCEFQTPAFKLLYLNFRVPLNFANFSVREILEN